MEIMDDVSKKIIDDNTNKVEAIAAHLADDHEELLINGFKIKLSGED